MQPVIMPSVILYAELLSNIRQISVVAELPTPQDSTTQVYLSPSRELLIIRHEGCATALRLPGEISATYVPKLPPPQPNVRQISWRIPLAPQPTQSRAAFPESSTAPWTSGDLTFSSSFACRKCYAVVIAPNTIKTWQDLPSANWAEMMDFWHCHKPDVPKAANNGANAADGGKENVEQKGYGANSSFNADKGVGKVDLTSFLIHEDDCSVKLVRHFSFTYLCHQFSHYALSYFAPNKEEASLSPWLEDGCQEGDLARASLISVALSPIQTPNSKHNHGAFARSQRSFLAYPLRRSMGYLDRFLDLRIPAMSIPRHGLLMGLS